MTEQSKPAESAPTVDSRTKPNRTTKPELPANVIRTELPDGTVLHNAVAESQ